MRAGELNILAFRFIYLQVADDEALSHTVLSYQHIEY